MTSPTADTISTVAISELLGVTRGTITNWKSRKDDFPEPVAGTARSPLYDRQEIFRWLIANEKATEKQLRGLGIEKIVVQLFDVLRSHGLAADVLSAAICYAHLSRNEELPMSERWSSHMLPDELAEVVRAADQWAQSSAVTHHMSIFAPLLEVLERSPERVYDLLIRISEVQDLEALADKIGGGIDVSQYGVLFLPSDFAKMIAELLPDQAKSVLESFCVTGSLGVACAKHRADLDVTVASPNIRVLEETVRWALVSDISLDVVLGDIIDEHVCPGKRVDAVVCNVPWGSNIYDDRRVRDTDPRWVFGAPRGDIHWALLQDALARLNPGGRAFVICPKPILVNTPRGARGIRGGLIRQGCIEAVITIPPTAFPDTRHPSYLLVLARPGETKDPSNILLVDVEKPQRRGERPDFPSAVRAYLTWINTASVDTESDHAFRAPVHEILAPQGTLDPTKWREAANRPDAGTLAEPHERTQTELENILAVTTTLDTRWTPQAGRASRYATIGPLSDIAIHRGASLDRRVLDADADTGVPVLSLAVLNGRASAEDKRYVDPETVRGKPVLTEPGDVIAHPTPNGIVATVWDESGWLPNSHAEILRITDLEAFDPEFLALCLSSRLITDPVTVGSIVPRAQSKNVTIPLVPIADQRSIVAFRQQIDTVAAYGERLTQSADKLQRLLADAAASGITMTQP